MVARCSNGTGTASESREDRSRPIPMSLTFGSGPKAPGGNAFDPPIVAADSSASAASSRATTTMAAPAGVGAKASSPWLARSTAVVPG